MNERPSTRSGVVGYVIVLVGIAGFVLSCFLPYAQVVDRLSMSYYELVTRRQLTVQYLGGLLFLFGGAATVAFVALAGLKHGRHERQRMPAILAAATGAWSSAWIGWLVSVSGGSGYEVGYWTMLVSVGVVVVGMTFVWVSGRRTAHVPDSPAGPEPPTEVPVGWTAGSP
jgi:hypothetical protein